MKKETAAERPHALLSCSGAHRWMNCPGSIKMSEGFPDKGSIYADEGTLAHEAGEALIDTGEISQEHIDKIDKFYADHPELDYSTQRCLRMCGDTQTLLTESMRKSVRWILNRCSGQKCGLTLPGGSPMASGLRMS